MAARSQLPGVRLFRWLRNASLRIGVVTGVYLSIVFVAWLVVANRFPGLQSFAGIRNLAGAVTVLLLTLIPVLRFRREPVRMFVAGLTAWTLLTLTYIGMEMNFSLLESRMGAFHIFMLGGITYCFVAVFHWVLLICVEARHQHVAQSAHAAVAASRHSIH
jgi:hypothetical protein